MRAFAEPFAALWDGASTRESVRRPWAYTLYMMCTFTDLRLLHLMELQIYFSKICRQWQWCTNDEAGGTSSIYLGDPLRCVALLW